jgi:3-oxoacyl-[acyl-carrier protein] reductase
MFDLAEAEFGGVDVLINNAGIMKLAKLADVSDDLFDRHIAINLKGASNFMREAAKRMRNGGRVVNISTSVVGTKFETYGVYAATKAALELMSQIMSKEMRGRNISVNAVAPGPMATKLFLDGKSDEVLDRIAKLNPFDRHAGGDCGSDRLPCSPAGAWVNGQIIRVNGGMI